MTARPQAGARKNRGAEISPARKAAFNILLAVERGRSHSDDLLRGKAVDALSAADRNLATALVLGALRWQIRLDSQIRLLLKNPNAGLDAEVRISLRLGAFQILHMDRIPARAAIDESVELAKQAGHRFASGMVNAVLRKLAGTPVADFPDSSATELALARAHPAWMVERWAALYGLQATREICLHGQAQAPLTIRVTDESEELGIGNAGIAVERGHLLTAARIVVSGGMAASAAHDANSIRRQDEGSQLVAEIAAANLNSADGCILDTCAAPGGKTLILAERCLRAQVVACEASAPRLEQLRSRMAGYGGRIECKLADVTQIEDDASFNLVLADVPCSGTGTLGRNPEIRHRLVPDDFARQAERQKAILHAALRALRPGGRVIYSTCSLEPEENEQVVAAVLAEASAARQVSLAATIAAMDEQSILVPGAGAALAASLTPEGSLRLLPGAFNTDGFFIALIEHCETGLTA
jgi:16S rRNA (cytosine967-C5)-methyltransferase